MSYKTGFYKGRLGIGLSTTMGMGDGNPRYPLDINGDIRLTGSIVNEKGKAIVGGGSSGAHMAIRKQALEEEPSWTIDKIRSGDGNVGIGTTSPGAKLDILGLTATSDSFEDRMLRLSFSTGYSQSKHGIEWYCTNVNIGLGAIRLEVGDNYLTPSMSFFIAGSNSGEKMRITNTGNVGIGTTSPDTPLHVRALDNHFRLTTTRSSGSHLNWSPSGGAGSDWDLRYSSDGSSVGVRLWFWYNGDQRFYTNNGTDRMIIKSNGNIGIGTTDPTTILTIKKPIDSSAYGSGTRMIDFKSYFPGYDETSVKASIYCGVSDDGSLHTRAGYMAFMTSDGNSTPSERMRIERSGNVGIGTTSPGYKLEVNGNFRSSGVAYFYSVSANVALYLHYDYWRESSGFSDTERHNVGSSHSYWVNQNDRVGSDNMYCSQYNHAAVYSRMGFMASSDRRIKKNIIDVPDNIALEKLRNIPCKYYDYIDKINGETTIGFIAQEVKEIFPIAVKITNDVIPSEMLVLNENNSNWEDCNDASGNIYYRLIIPDLSNNKLDQIYAFYDLSNNKINARTEPNKFNSFVFTKKFDSLFCYGKEVNDFHTLDKQKLFALNFSATQELDRKVIALEKENTELKAELAKIKQHLGL